MSELDLMPPAAPGQEQPKKHGFFSKMFGKKETPTQIDSPPSDDVDLDEIKRKLGLSEEPATPQETPQEPAPEIRDEDFAPQAPIDDLPVDETPEEPAPSMPEEPETPQKVEISDWSSTEEKHEEDNESSWAGENHTTPSDELPTFTGEESQHHAEVDQHLAPMEEQHDKILDSIQAAAPELEDWHLQEKEVSSDQYFILKNGQQVKSLAELKTALEFIDDETFTHHMNDYRNDFANWVRDVIQHGELADELSGAQSCDGAIAILAKHSEASAKKVGQHKEKTEKMHKNLEKVSEKIDKARDKVEQKHQDLVELKKKSTKKVKDALDQEIEKKVAHRHAEHDEKIDQLEEHRQAYESHTSEYENRLKKIEAREGQLESREAKLFEAQENLKEQRADIKKEKMDASDLLKDAKTVKRDLENAKKAKNETQANLRDIEKREGELSRKDETLKQREKKLAIDITEFTEQQEELGKLKAEHDEREAEVTAKEKRAEEMMQEAEGRKKEALQAERSATSKIKTETQKLDTVRKKIEDKLKLVIKNKKKAMYAAELRKHIEESVKATKHDIDQTKTEMEEDAYASYMDSKIATTPAGQTTASEDTSRIKDLVIYKKVEEARSALEKNKLDKAKELYNELRDEFPTAELSSPERNTLYTSIRELYDDIHLAMLEQ